MTAALPLIAVLSVATVFGYCWALFRNFDSEWFRTLTPIDIFSLGWSLTPGLLIGLAFHQHQRESQKKTSPKQPSPKWRWIWVIIRNISGTLIIITGLVAFLHPFARDLSESIAIAYYTAALWLLMIFGLVSTALLDYSIDDYPAYHRRSFVAVGIATFVIVDALGARIKHSEPGHIVQLENGQSLCAKIIFSGQNAVYLYHASSGESAMIDRRLVKGLIKSPECDSVNASRPSVLSKVLSSPHANVAK